MNCWGIRIYFNKSKFSLNGGYINLTFCSPCIMVIHKWISQPTTALIKFYLHFVSPVLFRMLCQWHAGAILPRRAGIADVTAIIATSRKQALLVSYLEANLTQIERWLREWRIAINVSKSNAMLFAKDGWRVHKPRPVQLLGEPNQWVDTARYLGVILDTPIT